jgi:hypothetical protein
LGDTVLLKNTNPLGEVDLPLIGRTLAAGEEFEVTNAQGEALLEQAGNYALADEKAEKARQVALAKKAKASQDESSEGEQA